MTSRDYFSCYLIDLVTDYKFGIQLTNGADDVVLTMFCARNQHDQLKFVEDLKESIYEVSRLKDFSIKWMPSGPTEYLF